MIGLRDLVEAEIYKSEQDALEDAVRHLLRERPDVRLRLAIHRYEHEGISLAKSAEVAGVSWAQMRDILASRGAQVRLGPEDADEAADEVDVLRGYLERGR